MTFVWVTVVKLTGCIPFLSHNLSHNQQCWSTEGKKSRTFVVILHWNWQHCWENKPLFYLKEYNTRMWANAQHDGRPAERRWRPLFNAAKFGW